MEEEQATPERRWRRPRALGTATAVVVMIVIVVIGGVGAYVAFNRPSSHTTGVTTCSPPNSPVCAQVLNYHDLGLIAPVKAVQQATPVPFTVTSPSGSASNFVFNFGDGSSPQTSSSATVDHSYANPGTYIVSVQATVGGATHDNAHNLVVVSVTQSYEFDLTGALPSVIGAVTANSSTTAGATAVLQPGQSVSVTGTYTLAPTNPAFALGPPKIQAPSGTVQKNASSASNASATIVYPNPGVYTINYVGTGVSSSSTAYNNYTWTVYVASSGVHAGVAGAATHASPHPGQIYNYEDVKGGYISLDPGVDYESAGFEIILNVYQTLVTYNGSLTGPTYQSYVPNLATCVPGSPMCAALYGGNTLISANGTDYTFVINSAAKFYDPATGTSWPVYPTDVQFSVDRTMAFSNVGTVAVTNGWILSQMLLPPGNFGTQFFFNATPKWILAATTLNESGECPSAAMTNGGHGCITFHVTGNNLFGHAWPFFLEAITDSLGASVVPCGWFSAPAQGAGIPFWTSGPGTSGNQGDHPCAPMTAAQTAAAEANVTGGFETGWNAWETAGAFPPYFGHVQFNMVGSGPYYLQHTTVGQSVDMAANPAWTQNPSCTYTGCLPAPGKYAKAVHIIYEPDQTEGEQAYAAGAADFASIPSTDSALLLQLIQQGKIGATIAPTLTVFQLFFAYNFSLARDHTYTSNTVNIPSNFFTPLAVRQFFVDAYPYATNQATVNTKDGLQYDFNYGGAIPQFMANYYPTNISWPLTDPSTACAGSGSSSPLCASWWWGQITTSSSPYYNAWIAANCKASSPCTFPIYGAVGAPDVDQRISNYIAEIKTLTGGAIVPTLVDITFNQVIFEGFQSPGSTALPMWFLGWIPDYPDPTDYAVPYYYPDSTYTGSGALAEQLNTENATGCLPAGKNWSDAPYYWANLPGQIPNNCQGNAYQAMFSLLQQAGGLPAGPQRVLEYNVAEHIAVKLALMVDVFQSNAIWSFGAWIDPSSINTNVTIGGGGDLIYSQLTGNDVQFKGAT
jgi:peptide/nickel transport system substrate-binding protein